MLSKNADRVKNLLSELNLNDDEINVYLALVEKSPQSALDLSRYTKTPRTRVYRTLEKLLNRKLVSIKMEDVGKRFEITDPKALNILVTEKEAEVASLKGSIPLLIEELGLLSSVPMSKSKVLYYEGIEGLKQVNWNTLKARNGVMIYEVGGDMSAFLDPKFSESIRQEMMDRDIFVKQLTNHKVINEFTKIPNYAQKFWEVRYLSPKNLKIDFEVIIYNDVYVAYTYKGSEVFCVEIYNQSLAEMQKQLFNFVWKSGKKMRVVSPEGRAIL